MDAIRREVEPRCVSPRGTTLSLLVLYLTGICARGYGYYNQTLKESPQVWMDVVHGTASAPEQYRVGVVMAAAWLTGHLRWGSHTARLSQIFGVFDLVGSVVAVVLLYRLLERTPIYQRSSNTMRWFASAAFALLVLYAVDWTNWYQKVGTLPSAALMAMMVWLWSSGKTSSTAGSVWRVAGILLVVAMQSLVRADLAVMLCLGVLAASILRLSPELSMPRGAAIATSVSGAMLAAAIQLYVARVLYPQANYGGVHAFMLPYDYLRFTEWAACLIFLTPTLWTLVQVVRSKMWGDGADSAVLMAALGYAVLWIAMGRLDEVRIFLPMALMMAPVTVKMAMLRVQGLS